MSHQLKVNESLKLHINSNGKFVVQFVAGINSKVRFQKMIGLNGLGEEKVLWTREMSDEDRRG